jgi:hypothetical protein
VNARNRQIVEARAAGRPLQAIALEHGLSVARVSQIVQDHRKDLRIAELEAEVARLSKLLEPHASWENFERQWKATRRFRPPPLPSVQRLS